MISPDLSMPLPDELGAVHFTGIGGSGTTSLDGSPLVTDSKNTGDQARVDPGKRHPRTAIGASAARRAAISLRP